MAKQLIHKGAISKMVPLMIRDTTKTDGSGLTGLTNASAGLSAYYWRDTDATATVISLTAGTIGTWGAGGQFVEVDSVNMPGIYQLSLPDAVLATGHNWATVMLKGAANMVVDPLEIQLSDVDVNDGVRFGLTALPNVASGSAGAIPTTGTGSNQIAVSSGQVLVQSGTATGQILSASGQVTVGTNNDKTGYSLASNAVDAAQFTQAAADKVWSSAARTLTAFSQAFADQVWSTASRTLTAFAQGFSDQTWSSATRTLSAFAQGFSDQVWISATRTLTAISTAILGGTWDALRSGHTTAGSFGEGVASVQGNVTGSTASVTGAVGSVTGNVGGNVTGSVGSVLAAVDILQSAADKVWATAARTLTAFSQTFSDQTWVTASRTLTAFAQGFSDQVWVSATRTLTSFGTLVADTATAVWSAVTRTLTSIVGLASDVWTFTPRTLTQTAAQVAAIMTGPNIVAQRGDSFSVSFTGLGTLVGRSKLWFTVKHYAADLDSAAIIQIEESGGLLFLNGAPATSGQGTLTVTNQTTGALTVTLAATAMATLLPGLNSAYDLQVDVGGLITTIGVGSFTVNADTTRATS